MAEATPWRWERHTFGWWLLKGDSARLNIELFGASAVPVEGTLPEIANALNAAPAYRELLEAARAVEYQYVRHEPAQGDRYCGVCFAGRQDPDPSIPYLHREGFPCFALRAAIEKCVEGGAG